MKVTRALTIACLLGLSACRPADAPLPLSDAAYVWQYAWTPPVTQGIARATSAMGSFMVLAADIDARKPDLALRVIPVDWHALAQTARETWPVIRINHALSEHIKRACDATADQLVELFRHIRTDAHQSGLALQGLQLDYDCPTEHLAEYAALLSALRERLPDTRCAVTMLPTWLGQSDFKRLVTGLDHFVLQVHSLDRPRDINAPLTLCDTTRIDAWTKKASALPTPYYIALPTYTYRVFFKPDGEFAALAAEGNTDTPIDTEIREISADPVAIAELVRTLHAAPPPHCRGIAWFRLPVDTDRLNWSWPLLQEVMTGQAPAIAVTAEIRNPKQDLYEIWLHNAGNFKPAKPLRIPIHWNAAQLIAADYVNGFHTTSSPGSTPSALTGPAPEPGASAMAAWFRLQNQPTNEQPLFKTGDIEVVQ